MIADGPDPLAERLAVRAARGGWSVEHLSYADASRRLSVARCGAACKVAPAVPIFLRLPHAANLWADAESQFHRAEMCSLVWGAAALSEAAVVNRPNAFGFAGRCALSTSVVRRRAGLGLDGTEVFASSAPAPVGPDEEWWLEQQADRATLRWEDRHMGRAPYRAARVRPGFDLCILTVVGGATFGEAPPARPDISASSAEMCAALGVTFATVTWRWYADRGVAEFARVNPHPTVSEVGESWDGVAAQLLSELSR